MSHINLYWICFARVAVLWVVLPRVCVIDLHYITESFINTAVQVDGEGPTATRPQHVFLSVY